MLRFAHTKTGLKISDSRSDGEMNPNLELLV